eukprot:7059068-Alexandrium_andersonii.AAC.1
MEKGETPGRFLRVRVGLGLLPARSQGHFGPGWCGGISTQRVASLSAAEKPSFRQPLECRPAAMGAFRAVLGPHGSEQYV